MTGEPVNCVVVGVGGQGIILISRIIGEAALDSDLNVMVSEIHGMAQRGGVVESAVLLGDAMSPIVSDGEADVLIGFEPLETMRALAKCNEKTLVITNTRPLPPFTVSLGQGIYPPVDEVLDLICSKINDVMALNGNELAEKAGNPLSLNMVMLGALFGSGALSMTGDIMKKTITGSTKKAFLESNLKAFDLGMEEAKRLKRKV